VYVIEGMFVGKLFVERPFVVVRMVAPRVLFSTLGVVAVAACLVALGDYHGYEGPVALESMAEHSQVGPALPSTSPRPRGALAAPPGAPLGGACGAGRSCRFEIQKHSLSRRR